MLTLSHSPPPMKYYLQTDGKEEGPLTAQEIKARNCQPADLVLAENSTEWVPVSSVKELAAEVESLEPLANPLAVVSLVPVALFALFMTFAAISWWGADELLGEVIVPVSMLASCLALIFGHRARNKAAWSQRSMKGYKAAEAGLVLGWLGVIVLGGCLY